MCSWCIVAVPILTLCVSLSTDSSKIAEETGKAWAAWCRDGYPLSEAFPLLPHLTLPLPLFISFYRLTPPPPIFPFCSRCGIYRLPELVSVPKISVPLSCLFGGVITSERTMCWHGDEEDGDSSEVKCLFDLCVPVIVAVISSDLMLGRSLALSLLCCFLMVCLACWVSRFHSVATCSSVRCDFCKDTGRK